MGSNSGTGREDIIRDDGAELALTRRDSFLAS